jgi:hypothetical protein
MNPSHSDPTNFSSASPASADIGNRQSASDQQTGEGTTPVREAINKGRRTARVALSEAKDTVGRVVLDQKGRAADRVGNYSSAVRESARALEQDDPNVAHFANQAADRIEAVADYIRDSDFSRLREDAEGVARRHPALFMGGMLLAGLVLGNMAKAAGQDLRKKDGDEDYSPGADFEGAGFGEQSTEDELYAAAERPSTKSAMNEGPSSSNVTSGY